jgi:hypothetical protein
VHWCLNSQHINVDQFHVIVDQLWGSARAAGPNDTLAGLPLLGTSLLVLLHEVGLWIWCVNAINRMISLLIITNNHRIRNNNRIKNSRSIELTSWVKYLANCLLQGKDALNGSSSQYFWVCFHWICWTPMLTGEALCIAIIWMEVDHQSGCKTKKMLEYWEGVGIYCLESHQSSYCFLVPNVSMKTCWRQTQAQDQLMHCIAHSTPPADLKCQSRLEFLKNQHRDSKGMIWWTHRRFIDILHCKQSWDIPLK